VVLDAETRKVYQDDCGNFIFKGTSLGECEFSNEPSSDVSILAESLRQLSNKEESVNSILKRILVEKFSTKSKNVEAWCRTFESESNRFALTGSKQIEVLKSCLDSSMGDWFSVQQTKLGLGASWPDWKDCIIKTFHDTSYNNISYALNFEYYKGSLIDYCVKKERLILDLERGYSPIMILDLIIAGLPNQVQKNLNPNSVTSIEKLHAKIRKFDTNDNTFNQNKNPSNRIVSNTFTRKDEGNKSFGKPFSKPSPQKNNKPCSICLKRGQRWTNHTDDQCNFNVKEKVKKEINTAEMETAQLSEDESKN